MPHSLDPSTIDRLEDAAAERFHQYYARRRQQPELPFPLEKMVETDLGLELAFVDLGSLIGDVQPLGMLCLPKRLLVIDNSLNPSIYPKLLGRYRFTIAHEAGHFCLHIHELDVAAGWLARDPAREVIREREADYFAGALLMPAEFVHSLWRQTIGRHQLRLEDLMPRRTQILTKEINRRQFAPENREDANRMLLEGAVSGLAERFDVSPWAMRIRCEELGLIVR